MPNHVTNVITAEAEVLAAIAAKLRGKNGDVDFNKLVPMPGDIPTGNLSIAEQRSSNGHNWHDWRTLHWGTKWNAYRIKVSPDGIRFDTAWDCPRPIIYALASLRLGAWEWAYADEDIGFNCGTFECDADGVFKHYDPATVFALKVKGEDLETYMRDREEDA